MSLRVTKRDIEYILCDFEDHVEVLQFITKKYSGDSVVYDVPATDYNIALELAKNPPLPKQWRRVTLEELPKSRDDRGNWTY